MHVVSVDLYGLRSPKQRNRMWFWGCSTTPVLRKIFVNVLSITKHKNTHIERLDPEHSELEPVLQDHHTPRLAVSYPKITILPVLQCLTPRSPYLQSCSTVVWMWFRFCTLYNSVYFLTDKYKNINFYPTRFKLLIFRHFPLYISLIFKELTSKESWIVHLVSRGSSFTVAVPINVSLLKKHLQQNTPSNTEHCISDNTELLSWPEHKTIIWNTVKHVLYTFFQKPKPVKRGASYIHINKIQYLNNLLTHTHTQIQPGNRHYLTTTALLLYVVNHLIFIFFKQQHPSDQISIDQYCT